MPSAVVIMLLTLLSQIFNRSNSEQNNGSISIKIFLYCSIPTFFLSSGLTLFVTSLAIHNNTCEQVFTSNFTLSDRLMANIEINFPIPDSYLDTITLERQNFTFFQYKSPHICRMKSLLKHCLTFENECELKNLDKNEHEIVLNLFDNIVLC